MLQLKRRKRQRPTHLWLTLALAVCLCLGALPATQGFMAFDHQRQMPEHIRRNLNNLIRRVHKEQWVIGYRYADNCPPAARNNGKAIEEAITTSLRAWLQPVRELNTGQPVVNTFRYVPNLVFPVPDAERKSYDLLISFFCDLSKSHALVVADEARSPYLKMHRGTVVDRSFTGVLLHEIGHCFGLLDTYRRPELTLEERRVSRGGLVKTIGHQPASVMNGLNMPPPVPTRISQDDANGIVWLYKFYHENLPLEDCIFPDYELEQSPDGCRPKYPLIFEIKHGGENLAIKVIREDRNTDVNAQDETGATALHYALAKGYNRLVDRLVIHPKSDVNVRNVEGSTPLFWAAKRGNYGLTERLLKHRAIDVNIRDTDGTVPLKVASTEGHTRIVALLLSQEQNERDWTPVTKESPSHHRSVFYLLRLNPPQIFHAGYLGTLPDGAALFAAQNAIEKYLKAGDFSLVGYQGLVSADINVRVLGSFPGRNGKTGNVLLSVRGVDLSAYEPLGLAVYPTLIETEVELLTYKFGEGILLEGRDVDKALNLALRSRGCVSVPNMELAGMDLGQHTCGPPNSVAVGSLLFDKANQTLIGFYRTQEGTSILGDGLPLADSVPEALIRLVGAKPVPPKNTLATLWGAIKAR